MNLQEKRLLELLQDHLSDNAMLTSFAATEITKHRRAVQELFLVLAISHLQELSRLFKSGKCPKRLEKLGKFAFDYEQVVLESSRFDRQIDPKAVERLKIPSNSCARWQRSTLKTYLSTRHSQYEWWDYNNEVESS